MANIVRCDVCGKDFSVRPDQGLSFPSGWYELTRTHYSGVAKVERTAITAHLCSIECIVVWANRKEMEQYDK